MSDRPLSKEEQIAVFAGDWDDTASVAAGDSGFVHLQELRVTIQHLQTVVDGEIESNKRLCEQELALTAERDALQEVIDELCDAAYATVEAGLCTANALKGDNNIACRRCWTCGPMYGHSWQEVPHKSGCVIGKLTKALISAKAMRQTPTARDRAEEDVT